MYTSQLEIACFSLDSALIAAASGANRIELCANQDIGGISPTISVVKKAKQHIDVPIYMMVRPRKGDFVYRNNELKEMKKYIEDCRALGVAGFVFGVLDKHGKVDIAANQALIKAAKTLPCTFHRAFDEIEDKAQGLQDLITCGFSTVLTAGGEGKAINFLPTLASLIQQAQDKIVVMPGGGIRSSNILEIHTKVQAKCYHSAASGKDDLPDETEIRKILEILGNKP